MDTLPKIEPTYSREVDEILGVVPPTTVRLGIAVIFLIFFAILVGTYFIQYPRIVSAEIVLTTLNSPAPLVSKAGGRIETWFVADGQIVEAGSPIALLQSTADFNHIKLLHSKLLAFTGNWESDIQNFNFPNRVVLGDVQNVYLNFHSILTRLKYYVEQNSISSKIDSQEELIKLSKQQYEISKKQKVIKEAKIKIARKFFYQDSLLFEQNKFGIPRREFDISTISFLQEQENLLAFDGVLKGLETSILQMQNEIMQLRTTHLEKLNEYVSATYESKQSLDNTLKLWMETYLLVSPVKGRVTFTNFWSSNQIVTGGQRLATIIPLKEAVIVGRAFISSSQLGQVEEGQQVNIKLAGFPFLKYGVIKGNVKTISLVPEEKGYVVEIELPNGMLSNYSEKLKFVHEMEGVAEIVVKKSRLIDRLINY